MSKIQLALALVVTFAGLDLVAQPVPLSLADLSPDTSDVYYRYALKYDGDSIGHADVEITYEAGHYQLREVTRVEGFNEIIVVHGEIAGLEPYAISVSGETAGHGIDCQMQIGQRIKGYARYPDHPDHPMRNLDTNYIPDLFERASSFFLYLPLMPLDSLRQVSFTQLNPLSCTLDEIVVTNTQQRQRIRTQAGRWDTTRIEFRGGQTAQNFYVSTSKPRRIARIEFEELPWTYELIAFSHDAL